MPSIFTKIINREIPAYIIAEDDQHIAFLDINPIQIGHTLVVPKIEVDEFFNLPSATYLSLMAFAQQVASQLKKSISCNRIGMTVIGLEVPHAHIHLIPINNISDLDFTKKRILMDAPEMKKIALEIIQQR